MYAIGDNVCHSIHGVGVIESVEEKQIQGQTMQFSVVAFERMKVMINQDRAKDILRPPVSPGEAEQVLEFLGQPLDGVAAAPGGHAQQAHQAVLKSGDPFRLAELTRSLVASARERKLSVQEKDVLREARAMLVQELAFVLHEDAGGLEHRLDGVLGL